MSSSRQYYYGNFQRRYRDPAQQRTAKTNCEYGEKVDGASNTAQQEKINKEYGVTGVSILYCLYDLCQFDPVKDLMVDAMHAIVLNLIRSELESIYCDPWEKTQTVTLLTEYLNQEDCLTVKI